MATNEHHARNQLVNAAILADETLARAADAGLRADTDVDDVCADPAFRDAVEDDARAHNPGRFRDPASPDTWRLTAARLRTALGGTP